MKKIILTILITLAILGLCFYLFSDIVTYITLSLLITAILNPIVDLLDDIRIKKFNFPRSLAVLIAFCTLVGVLFLFMLLFVPLVSEQIDYIKSVDKQETQHTLSVYVNQFDVWLHTNKIVGADAVPLMEKMETLFRDLVTKLNLNAVLSNLAGATGSVLVLILAVSFMSFFFLMRKGLLRDLLLKLVPNAYFEMTVTAFFKIKKLLSNYLFGLLVQMFSVFILVSLFLTVLGIDYAFTIGVFAALVNLVPYVGPFLGIMFAILVSFTTGEPITETSVFFLLLGKLGIAFGAVQLLDNVLLQPVIFSKSVKAHPLEIFVTIFVGASLAGAIGMIIAIPCYTIIKVMVIEFQKGYKTYSVFNNLE